LDPSRRKMKKVDSTVTLTPSSNPLKYRVNMEASVKRIRAKCVDSSAWWWYWSYSQLLWYL
jgi:hypothetical protein